MTNGEAGTYSVVLEAGGDDPGGIIREMSDRLEIEDAVERVRVEVTLNEEYREKIKPPVVDGSGLTGPEKDPVSFDTDSDACKLTRYLYDNDSGEWFTTPEVRRELGDELQTDVERISQLLWDLSERGIVDKRDNPDDNRMNEYRITGHGKRSVERSEDDD